jgi:hypothetical protein
VNQSHIPGIAKEFGVFLADLLAKTYFPRGAGDGLGLVSSCQTSILLGNHGICLG